MKQTNDVTLSESALNRILQIKSDAKNYGKFLRIGVSSGGCSGFQYLFNLDDKINEDDLMVYEKDAQIIAITDETSLQFLQGSKVNFVSDLGASYFKVENPNASANCGCGSSFSV